MSLPCVGWIFINQPEINMNKKRTLLTLGLTGLVIAASIFVYSKYFNAAQSLKVEIAKAFDRPVELIELNLPPADGRYPGSVLVSPVKGQTLVMKRQYRPVEVPNASSNFSITIDDDAEAGVLNRLLGNVNSTGSVKIKVDLADVRMYEIDVSTELKEELLDNESVINAEKNGLLPRTIVRAYEAIVTYSLTKSSSLSGEAWEKVKKGVLDIGGKINHGGGVSIAIPEPTVIAYESLLVEYISTNLSGKPDLVRFKEYVPDTEQLTENSALEQYQTGRGNKNVFYITLGNSRYQSNYFGNLRLVEESTSLVSEVLSAVGANQLTEENNDIISKEEMDLILDDLRDSLRNKDSGSLLIFYYVGHAISGTNGQMYLVMNDYNGNPEDDIGSDYMHGLSRELLDEPISPVGTTNFNDLFDVLYAVTAEYPEDIEGLYPVSKIAQRLHETNMPFIILIDACYGHEDMDRLRDELSITQSGDYFGPKINGGPEEVRRYVSAIRQFGNVPYLNSTNVVLLSSAPGSVALEVSSPKPDLFKSKFVAPMAKKIYNQYINDIIKQNSIKYGDFFYELVDVKELGESNIHGITSWSDFSEINQVEMLSKVH